MYLQYLVLILVPFAIAWVAYSYNVLLGIAVTVLYLAAVVWWQRPNLLAIRGRKEYAKGNNTRALELLEKAHRLDRGPAANSILYAYILLRCGRADDAEKVLNFVLLDSKAKKTDKMLAKQNLSLVRYRRGELSEAVRLMEEVFENYKTSGVYGVLGYYKILTGSPDAMEFAKQAYDYNPDDKVIIDNYVQLCLAEGDIQKAKELSDKSLAAGNKGVEIYYHAGQIELAQGRPEKAAEFFKKALAEPRSFLTTVPEEDIKNALKSAYAESGADSESQ